MLIQGEQVANHLNSDCELIGIVWREQGRDLQLNFRLPSRQNASLTCTYAMGVSIDLTFEDNEASFPFSFDTKIQKNDNGAIHVLIDFAHTGSIQLNCNTAELAVTDDC